MAKIIIASKKDVSVLQETQNNQIVLNQPSIIQVAVSKDDILSIVRSGNNAVITLKNGEKIVVENFFSVDGDIQHSLTFKSPQGELNVVEFDQNGKVIRYNPVADINDLVQSNYVPVQQNVTNTTESSQESSSEGGTNWKSLLKTGALIVGGEALYLWAFDNDDDKSSKNEVDLVAPAVPTASLDADGKLVTGKAEAFSTVYIRDSSGNILGQVNADQEGNFKIELKTPLTDGNRILVSAKDAAGNESKLIMLSGSKDTIAPETANAQINTKGDIVSGKAEADAKIYIYAADGTTLIGGPVIAAKDGSFSVSLNPVLKSGEQAKVVVQDSAGNKSNAVTVEIGKDTLAPDQPKVSISRKGDVASGTAEPNAKISIFNAEGKVIVSGVADGTGAFSLTLSPVLGEKDKASIVVEDAVGNKSKALELTLKTDSIPPSTPTATLDDAGLQITGKAEANAKIEIRSTKDGTLLESATANSEGVFTIKLSSALTDNNAINIYAIDSAGNSSQAQVVRGSKDTIAPSSPDLPTVTDDSEAVKKVIKNGETTSDTTPLFEGRGEVGATVTIYDNGVAITTAKVDSSGKWNLTLDQALADGVHNFSFTQMDSAKNTSSMSESFTFTVKAAAVKVASLSLLEADTLSDLLVVPTSSADDESRGQNLSIGNDVISENELTSSNTSVVEQLNIADLLSYTSLIQDDGSINLADILPIVQDSVASEVVVNTQVESKYIELSPVLGTELDLLSNPITYYV